MLQPPSRTKWHRTPGFISWPRIVPSSQPSQQAVHSPHSRRGDTDDVDAAGAAGWGMIGMILPQHFLYLRPLPHGHGSFLPAFMSGTGNHHILLLFLYTER